jgi:hypothetical protein
MNFLCRQTCSLSNNRIQPTRSNLRNKHFSLAHNNQATWISERHVCSTGSGEELANKITSLVPDLTND